MKICSVDNCQQKAIKKGMCDKHYTRVKRYGNSYTCKRVVGDDKRRFADSFLIIKTGCWEWKKRIHHGGYGVFYLKRKPEQAHRAAWVLFKGEIPKGLYVLHKCHNRSCVNPDHLYIGTHQDNMNDMVKAGRSNKVFGENHGKAKITCGIAKTVKESRDPAPKLAKKLDIPIHIISDIRRGKTWRHVQ